MIHNYRWRLGLADGEKKYEDFEKRLAQGPVITALHPDPNSYVKKFSGKYLHRTIRGGIGHNLPQEAPEAFAAAIVEVDDH